MPVLTPVPSAMSTLIRIRRDVEPPSALVDAPSIGRVRVGVAASVVATAGLTTWIVWRIGEMRWNPVSLALLAADLVGLAAAIAVTLGLTRTRVARNVFRVGGDARDSYWFAFTVADIVGRTRSADLHRDVRTAVRAAPRWRPRDSADAAIAAVLADGPRRLVVVVAIGVGLLVGVAPFGVPPWWALTGLVVGAGGFGTSHVVLGRGRLRYGDRIRWSYGAIGELIERTEVATHAPRRWRGALAVTVGLSLAVGLRGTSDRWTHGLGPMSHDDRVVAMGVATALILGALFTMQTSVRPETAHLPVLVRHLDERTGRQSLLTVAVCVAAIGLVAGAATPDLTAPAAGPHLGGVIDAEMPRPEIADGDDVGGG